MPIEQSCFCCFCFKFVSAVVSNNNNKLYIYKKKKKKTRGKKGPVIVFKKRRKEKRRSVFIFNQAIVTCDFSRVLLLLFFGSPYCNVCCVIVSSVIFCGVTAVSVCV